MFGSTNVAYNVTTQDAKTEFWCLILPIAQEGGDVCTVDTA